MQLHLSNTKIIFFEIVLIFLSIGLLFQVAFNNQELHNASEEKLLMLKTADRLRQSSDDLTHFARTYVITGDEKFKKQYFDTLNIRDGKKARPLNYHSIYWDLNKNIREINHQDTTIKISLDDIFQSLPYDKNEMKKLETSKFNSDDLVNLEIEAFNAMIGKFRDDRYKYSIKKEPNQQLAIRLMHSKEYYDAKHKIMQPIDEFILMLDKRTTENILNIQLKSETLFLLFLFAILIFIIGNYFILKFLYNEEKIKHKEKSLLLLKQKELNIELKEKSIITQKLNRELEESEYELQTINENLKKIVDEEVEKNIISQQHLFKTEKMASMGEMIGNIAHQWRQPLSMISTGATGMKLQKEYDLLSDEVFIETCNSINHNAQYLSKTIDDFRNFIKEDRVKSIFNLKDIIDNFLSLVDTVISVNHIDIILNLEKDLDIEGYENELIQSLLTIFNNAKDILIEKELRDKLIFITTFKQNDEVIIKIKDNGGGIAKNILNKIFEPYFTTKHKSQGTGLGLNMTYNLITSGMNGTIEANNVEFKHNGINYIGAEFIIKLKGIQR